MKDLNFLKNIHIAHRGIYNNETIIENTKEAFISALNNKIPIEFDIHITKDDSIIIFHDKNLKRLTLLNKKTKNLTKNDLEQIKLKNTNSKIPLLVDILKLINGKILIDIEIKSFTNPFKSLKNLCEILDNYNGKFIIKSFNPLYIGYIRLFRNNYIRGLLINNKIIKIPFIFLISKPDFICCDKNIRNHKKIKKYIQKNNTPLLCYGIKEKNPSLNCHGYIIDKNI